MRFGWIGAVASIGLAVLLPPGVANAADVKVMAGAAMSGLLRDLGPEFERKTGHKLATKFGLGPALKRQIEGGEDFDVVILSPSLIDDLIKQGKVAAGTRAAIARSGVSVAVRAGAAKPDIGSVDKFKRALMDTKSITYVLESETGLHLAKVFDQLGIREQMKSKTMPQQEPGRVPRAVAEGQAEFGLALTSVLAERGVELAGLLPAELQNYLVFTAGASAKAKDPEAAKSLIAFLTAPEIAAVLSAKGWERVAQ